MSQYDPTPRPTHHAPFYLSTDTPVLPQSREANTNGNAAATTSCDAIAGQIDRGDLHSVESYIGNDKENEGRCAVLDGSALSLIRRVRSGFVFADILAPSQYAQENHPSTHSGLILQTSPASLPELAHQSQYPTRTEVHSPASNSDMDPMHSRQGAPAGLIRQESSSRKRRQALQRVYDKPGKKPAVAYEPNILILQELFRQRGGQDFAIAWVAKVFTTGITAVTLIRTLSEEETDVVDHDHGFRLSQAYDGFLEKVGDRFECGLCPKEKRSNWANKKCSIRHFQKFHFGIGETCGKWWVGNAPHRCSSLTTDVNSNKTYYSRAELNRHLCSDAVTPVGVA